MLRKLQQLRNKESGFTIIEVLIVLAIAALIMVIVLIAIPQLQRNQRNTARKELLGRIVTEIGNYSGANNGKIPLAVFTNAAVTTTAGKENFGVAYDGTATNSSFIVRYLGCTLTDPAALDTACSTNINDPRTRYPVTTGADGTTTSIVTGADPGAAAGDMSYRTTLLCDGEFTTATNATTRNFALQMRLEGGAIYCLDNK